MRGYHEEIAFLIGERLTELRKAKGLSQEEISFRAGLHRTEVSQLERGIRVPRVDTLIKLATSLEATLDEIVGQLTWKPGGYQAGTFTVGPREETDGGESR